MDHAADDRVLPLDGIHNFRDYGGYAIAGGGRLASGRLWRSAQHRDATDTDLGAVQSLGLGAIIDLRGESEREENPCRRAPSFDTPVYFGPGETAGSGNAPHLAAAKDAITGDDAANALKFSYLGMPWRENLLVAFRHYFDALETGQPSLVHCFAGKDRTGVIVALFHRLVGVHEDDVMADYMLTNIAGKADERIAAGAKHIRSRYGPGITEEGIRALMLVREDYLATAFDAIVERHGDVHSYADSVLEITPERVARLRELYVS